MQLLDVELTEPLPRAGGRMSVLGVPYRRAVALVRLHRLPLGTVELDLAGGQVPAPTVAVEIWGRLGAAVNRHLRADGLPTVESLPAGGLTPAAVPPCGYEHHFRGRQPPFVSVVVPTAGRPEALTRCLDSVLAQTYPSYEVLVVDNAPGVAGTAEVVRGRHDPQGRLRHLAERRRGSSPARNRGLVEARGEIVAFADDDVVCDRHWLSSLVRGFQAADGVGCVTGLVRPAELETPAQLLVERYGAFDKGYRRRIFDLDRHRSAHPLYPWLPGGYGTGASMAFDTELLRRLGGFDRALGIRTPATGGEDLDCFLSVVLAGYRLVYEPAAIVWHAHRRDRAGLRRQVFDYGVGLSSLLTKRFVQDRRSRWQLLSRVPLGVAHALRSGSAKNVNKPHDYPRRLTMLEVAGMCYGPLAYLRSRRRARKSRWDAVRAPHAASAPVG